MTMSPLPPWEGGELFHQHTWVPSLRRMILFPVLSLKKSWSSSSRISENMMRLLILMSILPTINMLYLSRKHLMKSSTWYSSWLLKKGPEAVQSVGCLLGHVICSHKNLRWTGLSKKNLVSLLGSTVLMNTWEATLGDSLKPDSKLMVALLTWSL